MQCNSCGDGADWLCPFAASRTRGPPLRLPDRRENRAGSPTPPHPPPSAHTPCFTPPCPFRSQPASRVARASWAWLEARASACLAAQTSGGKHGLLMLRTRGVCNAPSFWVRRLYPHARRQASDARQHAHLMTDRRGADGRPIRPWCQATVGDERATAEDERAAGGGCAFQPPALAAMLKLHRGRLANTTREHREAALSGRCRYPHCRYQMRSPLDLSLNKMKRRSFEHTVCTTSSSSTSLFGRGNPCA